MLLRLCIKCAPWLDQGNKALIAFEIFHLIFILIFIFFSALLTQVKPCLEKLNQDSDIDVKYFSAEALESKN